MYILCKTKHVNTHVYIYIQTARIITVITVICIRADLIEVALQGQVSNMTTVIRNHLWAMGNHLNNLRRHGCVNFLYWENHLLDVLIIGKINTFNISWENHRKSRWTFQQAMFDSRVFLQPIFPGRIMPTVLVFSHPTTKNQ